eukprot:768811-Hanusia_phi.AAC.6
MSSAMDNGFMVGSDAGFKKANVPALRLVKREVSQSLSEAAKNKLQALGAIGDLGSAGLDLESPFDLNVDLRKCKTFNNEDEMSSWIQNMFLGYRSPNTSPRRYLHHYEHASVKTSAEHYARKTAKNNQVAKKCTPDINNAPAAEILKGNMEIRDSIDAERGMKVLCTLTFDSLQILSAEDMNPMGNLKLEETYVTVFEEHACLFMLGTRRSKESREKDWIFFACNNELERRTWVRNLQNSGSRLYQGNAKDMSRIKNFRLVVLPSISPSALNTLRVLCRRLLACHEVDVLLVCSMRNDMALVHRVVDHAEWQVHEISLAMMTAEHETT